MKTNYPIEPLVKALKNLLSKPQINSHFTASGLGPGIWMGKMVSLFADLTHDDEDYRKTCDRPHDASDFRKHLKSVALELHKEHQIIVDILSSHVTVRGLKRGA